MRNDTNGYGVPFGGDGDVLEIDSGDECTTSCICQHPLNCTI